MMKCWDWLGTAGVREVDNVCVLEGFRSVATLWS